MMKSLPDECILVKDQHIIIPLVLWDSHLTNCQQVISKCQQATEGTMYWPGIDGNIQDYIKRCPVCIKAKPHYPLSHFFNKRSSKALAKNFTQKSLNGTANTGFWLVATSVSTCLSFKQSYLGTHCHFPAWRDLCNRKYSSWGFHWKVPTVQQQKFHNLHITVGLHPYESLSPLPLIEWLQRHL